MYSCAVLIKSVDLWNCIGTCPCFDSCPNGCQDCSHPLCACYDQSSDQDFMFCSEYAELGYRKCTLDCQHDISCYQKCEDQFQESLNNCPCNPGCPNGCPCENYECMYASTTSGKVLTLMHYVGFSLKISTQYKK